MKRALVLVMLSSLLFLGAAPAPNVKPQRVTDWTFAGCFQPPNQTQCYDAYVRNGAYWVCRACGTTGTPDETKCHLMTPYEEWFGLWCS
jgi:hypothetical protein